MDGERSDSPSDDDGFSMLSRFYADPAARGPQLKRDGLVQTALDVVVVSGATTVGDVLIGSIPSQPTTVSLPGYGLLTLSGFVPATATPTGSLTSSLSSTAPFPTMTGSFNSTTASGINVKTLMVAHSNSTTSLLNSTTTSMTVTSTSSTTSSSTTSSLASSSFSATSSVLPGGGAGGSAPTSQPTNTSGVISNASSSSSNPHAGQIAGGVVGGVAGALLIGVILFLLARRFRDSQNRPSRLDDEEDAVAAPTGPRDGGPGNGPMAQRSSYVPFAAALGRLRQSQQSSIYTAEPSDRGFQRISGRKLMPVSITGGDGYSDPPAPPARQLPMVAHNLSTEFLPPGEMSTRADQPTEFGSYDPGVRIPGEQFVTNETNNTQADVLRTHRPLVPPSSDSSLRVVPEGTRSSALLDNAGPSAFSPSTAAALRSQRVFSSSPDSFDEHLAAATSGGSGARLAASDSPSPDLTIQAGAQRTPIIARRPGDGLGRSRPSQDGSRVSRFSETF